MKYKIFLAVFVISLISSVILASNSSSEICQPGNGCDIVGKSPYGSTFGIQNAYYGIFLFSIMIFLTLFHIKRPTRHTRILIHSAIIVAAIISLYFLYIQFFVIKAICEFCIVIDAGSLVSLGFLIYLWKH
ncbi:MAG: vitamin K epoxide reductase family protein [Nanoarchaeota archaeon]